MTRTVLEVGPLSKPATKFLNEVAADPVSNVLIPLRSLFLLARHPDDPRFIAAAACIKYLGSALLSDPAWYPPRRSPGAEASAVPAEAGATSPRRRGRPQGQRSDVQRPRRGRRQEPG